MVALISLLVTLQSSPHAACDNECTRTVAPMRPSQRRDQAMEEDAGTSAGSYLKWWSRVDVKGKSVGRPLVILLMKSLI